MGSHTRAGRLALRRAGEQLPWGQGLFPSGSEAKGAFDVTRSVLTRTFVSAVSTGNRGRLTQGCGADAQVVLELSPLLSDAVTRSRKGFVFSIGDKNTATETP